MKDFMLIFKGKSYDALKLTPEQIEQRMGKWFAWHQKMETDGVRIKTGDALQDPVRVMSGTDRAITDTASPETKELIGGFYILTVNDLAEATKIAEDFPDYDLGSVVEIRELMIYDV